MKKNTWHQVDEAEPATLGPCCVCEATGATVRNIFLLPQPAAVPGHGWGCLVCGLPSNGACYVLCDECAGPFDAEGRPRHPAIPRFACRGRPASDGREPIALTYARGHFDHDTELHPELPRELS